MAVPFHNSQAARRFQRRGSGYVLVLGAAMLVSVIGLSSLTLVRVQWQAEQAGINTGRARLYARSAVEAAVAYTLVDPEWRADYARLISYMPMQLGQDRLSVAVTELDGSPLLPGEDSPVLITGTGIIGSAANPQAICRWSVEAQHGDLDLLRAALHAAGNISITGGTLTVAKGAISSSETLSNNGTIHGDVQARSVVNWGWINGTVTTNVPAKQLPSSAAWNYYSSLPASVVLPAASVGAKMEYVLLSPDSNPWEPASKSPAGVYYIRPSGDLTIRNCRIVGTLLVDLPSGKKLVIDQGALWSPARPDYPSLLVNGPCEIRLAGTLYEASRTNFNPAGTPYQGQSDTDLTDSYSSLLQGVFHVMGPSLRLESQSATRGVLIVEGTVSIKDSVQLRADPKLWSSPPIKYKSSELQLEPGTWRQVAAGQN